MARSAILGIIALLAATSGALAVQPDELLRDPALEGRARAISADLRCLVCQNQSIDDSDAPLARDLRLLVRERLQSGDTDAGVKDYVVRRYGEFVLLKPPLAWHTALLWVGPAAIVFAALCGMVLARTSRRRVLPADGPLSEAEAIMIARLRGGPERNT